MGDGAKRVLAELVGSFCDGRRSGRVDKARHLRHTQFLRRAFEYLGTTIVPGHEFDIACHIRENNRRVGRKELAEQNAARRADKQSRYF